MPATYAQILAEVLQAFGHTEYNWLSTSITSAGGRILHKATFVFANKLFTSPSYHATLAAGKEQAAIYALPMVSAYFGL